MYMVNALTFKDNSSYIVNALTLVRLFETTQLYDKCSDFRRHP